MKIAICRVGTLPDFCYRRFHERIFPQAEGWPMKPDATGPGSPVVIVIGAVAVVSFLFGLMVGLLL